MDHTRDLAFGPMIKGYAAAGQDVALALLRHSDRSCERPILGEGRTHETGQPRFASALIEAVILPVHGLAPRLNSSLVRGGGLEAQD
jgi:hypothetical protein